MKHSIQFISTLLALGLPIAAQASCERYMNSTLILNLPATVTVPDNLPVGGEIISGAFSGTAPAFFTNCYAPYVAVTGRYQTRDPTDTLVFRTEVPGVGVRLRITDARGTTHFFAMHNRQGTSLTARVSPSFTAAELKFYKIGPVTDGVVTAGDIWQERRDRRPESFTLRLGNAVRFIRPAATCNLATGDVNRMISLDPIKVSTLQNATHTGERNFELTANCTNASNVTFRFSGTPAPGNDQLLANTGTAGGVAVWLYSRLNGRVQNLLPSGPESTRTVAVSGNRAVLPLGAAYHRNGTVSQGTLVSTATVNITYN
ncbi:fimbrial protein [Pseudomonas grimontii]|uniref:fimbrial protein n=1 Tax=Pseudomonas grimontii TaxID=129847 RepID=UPI0021682322|nr:fimbrial protein [Pseudomonas grimontii]MCS3513006.1 type 1 fimbria pilin [Pseudomonas grimontii]